MSTHDNQTVSGKTYHQKILNRSGPAPVAAGHLRDRQTTLNIQTYPANADGQEQDAEAVHRWRHFHLRPEHADAQPIHVKRRYDETLILMLKQMGLN